MGTVRGPFRDNGSVQFMVRGKDGWVPFVRSEKYPGQHEAECEKSAKDYASKLTKVGAKVKDIKP